VGEGGRVEGEGNETQGTCECAHVWGGCTKSMHGLSDLFQKTTEKCLPMHPYSAVPNSPRAHRGSVLLLPHLHELLEDLCCAAPVALLLCLLHVRLEALLGHVTHNIKSNRPEGSGWVGGGGGGE